MSAPCQLGIGRRRARVGYRVVTGLVVALFLAALAVYTCRGYAVRNVYWTLHRVAVAVLG